MQTLHNGFNIDLVPSFGRYLHNYRDEMKLDLASLKGKRVLDCASGGASFPAEAMREGINVVAVDPLFSLPFEAIVEKTNKDILHVVTAAAARMDLLEPSDRETLQQGLDYRYAGNKIFLEDFPKGVVEGRYIAATLPQLPFADKTFDVSLLGHLLFCYEDRLDYDFHLASIKELVRVTREETRIYPVRGLNMQMSQILGKLRENLDKVGIMSELIENDAREVRYWKEILILREKVPA